MHRGSEENFEAQQGRRCSSAQAGQGCRAGPWSGSGSWSARAKQSPKPVKSAKPSGRGSSDAVSIEGSQDPERRKIEHNLRRIMTELPIATPASALCHGFDIADFTQKTLVCELVRKQILKDCSWIASRMMLMMTLMKTNIRSGDADPAQELHQVHLGR